jgi:superfamily II DNA or RNA helicase
MSLLGLPSARIGQVGGGRNRQSGTVDLGMLQTLKRIPDLPGFFSDYGFVVIDECHHVPAATFEACLKQAPVRYILGLTATPYRRDGLQALITMQCGPVRHTMRDENAGPRPILFIRDTGFVFSTGEETGIQDIFAALVKDPARNSLIEKDIRDALAEGRQCLILSDRKDHCREVADRIMDEEYTPFVLDGSLGKKERERILKDIRESPAGKGIAIIATGQYLGEGFDCPQVDAIFLAFPLSFRGKLVQYVGRVLRTSPGKPRPRIYDYSDGRVPMLKAMAAKRMKAYKALGVEIADDVQDSLFGQAPGNPPAGT